MFLKEEIMGWTSGLPEIMETSSAHWDEMTFFLYFANLGSLIRNAPVICNHWPPPPPPHTHLRVGRGIAGLMCETLAFWVPPQCRVGAGLVILCIYTPLNLLLLLWFSAGQQVCDGCDGWKSVVTAIPRLCVCVWGGGGCSGYKWLVHNPP